MRAVCAASVLLLAQSACRSEPVNPQELLAAHALGLNYLQRGQLPEAEAEFRKVTSLAPRDPIGHTNLGLTYLRAERYREAEAALRRAQRLNDKNTDVGLILAKLYSLTDRPDEARTTLERLPRDARVLYALAELETAGGRELSDTAALRRYHDRLVEVQRAAPANLAVRIRIADVLARRGVTDSAAVQLEEIGRIRPEPPAQARPHLDSALQHLRRGTVAEARAPLDRFLRAMELTAPYQSSLDEVKWEQGPLVGRPILAFNPQSLLQTRAIPGGSPDAPARFVDMTAESGLSGLRLTPTAIVLGDPDGDGVDNLLVVGADATQQRFETHVYNVVGGFVADVSERTGIALPTGAVHGTFADFDNDGWLDLFAIGGDARGRGYLLRNLGSGRFEDVTATARVADVGAARKALFVDLDHDGDLDLLLVGGVAASPRVYRNNLDGTFADVSDPIGLGGAVGATDAAFGDFDGDGRIDIVLGKSDGSAALYLNTGFQRFRDASASSGIRAAQGSDARVAVADYDNSGTLDILVTSAGATGEPSLWRNSGDGTFSADSRSRAALQPRARVGVVAARFFDHDNDGWVDLILASARGVSLFRNDGTGRFEDRSSILPPNFRSRSTVSQPGAAIAVADIDEDGDLDLYVGDSTGVHVLRNDGGNANMGMVVQLLGLRTGGGKNNNFGIGAKLELRTGEIYQSRVVTSRLTHFGLGQHLKADVLRVQWTNGVPETIYFPGTDADVLELEQLKGSCAFLYTWDGKRFRFVTDVMWQSALGMPVGLMGGGNGSAAYAPAGPSQEYLRIPGDALQPRDGRYVLQLTEELWETAYVDEVQLIAVDHPDSVDLYVDERFPPPLRTLRTYSVAQRRPPLSATDDQGNDLLPALREKDDVYVSTLVPIDYQGLVREHDLVLDLGRDAGRPGTTLLLRGWIYPTDASINVALAQQNRLKAAMPSLAVRNAKGEWQTAMASIGFPSGKDKTVVVDLAGIFPTSDRRVRLRTNMRIHWDQAVVGTDVAASPIRKTVMRPVSADLHFRGYSKMYRKGGRTGPQWFAYDSVRREAPWRTIEGAFTRFGDVRSLLRNPDDMYAIMAPGDEITLEFDASEAGTPPPGWRRTFLLYSDGWIKDADLNTAFGNTVEPLPFHAIKSYPYPATDSYPSDSAHARYRRDYNTRVLRRSGR
jgi:tetratricopeptide (TPR) repeat protein